MGIVTAFIGLFTGKAGKIMWPLLGVLLLVGTISIGWLVYQNTVKDNALLKSKNGELEQAVKDREEDIRKLVEDQRDFTRRANSVMISMGQMQQRMGRNAVQQQTDFDNIVTRPGSGATMTEIERKANSGMNSMFSDLQAMSREGIDENRK